MITLLPMRPEVFETYAKGAIAGYADDNVSAGRWPAEGAQARSQSDFESSLPEGLDTANNYLFEVRHEAELGTVGFLWLAAIEKNGLPSAFIYDVEILPEFRRRGFAKAAVHAAEPIARALGLDRIGLHVFANNPGAQALYASLGYAITGFNMQKLIPDSK